MQRREFLQMSALVAQPAVQRPNVVLLMTDQQTHHAWSGAKNPWLSTPAMDSIAARGTVFDEAYCNYPVCSPSRGSIFSSRLPHETGVMTNGKGIHPEIPTMGEIFRSAGYRTAYAGKWHLPKTFDGMTAFEKIAGGHALGAKMDEPVADACTAYLKQAGSEPFLLVASFMNPHDICDWIRQHPGARSHPGRASYPPAPQHLGVDPLEPEMLQYHRKAGYDLMSQAVGIAADWKRDDFRHYLHDYYRMVETVDRQIGRVLEALRVNQQLDRTIIAFTSDHGEGMGAHRWVQKAAFWEETIRVPLFFAGPGIARGQRSRELASLVDLMPTLCDYAGIERLGSFRGESLRPTLEGKAQPREFVTAHLRYESAEREGRMLRTQRYKYCVYSQGKRNEQLFDLELDPGEGQNLVGVAGMEGVLEAHRKLLRGELKRTQDPFVAASL
jgi:arylsulfatase A-like enzyme